MSTTTANARSRLTPASLVEAVALDACLYRHARPDLLPDALSLAARNGSDLDLLAAEIDQLAAASEHEASASEVFAACADADPLVVDAMCDRKPQSGGAVFLGSGLTTFGQQAKGLAFDVLAMVLVAEDVRRVFGLARVVHLVADHHASYNAFVDPREIATLAASSVRDLRQATRALGLDDYVVCRASELQDDALHRSLMVEAGGSIDSRYVRREVADIEWARRQFGASVKVGWAMSASREPRGWDERRFDDAHREAFGPGPARVYVVPGRADDPGRPRVSPYAWLASEHRLLLRPSGADPPGLPSSKGMRRHLDLLAARLEVRLGAPGTLELPARLDRLQRLLFPAQASAR